VFESQPTEIARDPQGRELWRRPYIFNRLFKCGQFRYEDDGCVYETISMTKNLAAGIIDTVVSLVRKRDLP
jgi:hypothetical protein